MDAISTLLTAGITSGVVYSALVWLAKTWLSERLKQSIQHEYSTLLELHRSSLKGDADTKLAELQARLTASNAHTLERLKVDLQLAAAERQLRSKHRFDREAEAIAKTYEHLGELRVAVSSYVSIMETQSMGTRSNRRDAVNAALSTFHNSFRLHRLFLSRDLADETAQFVRSLSHKAIDFSVRIDTNDEPDRSSREAWIEVDRFMDEEAPRLFDKLENAYRRRLGQEDA